MILQFTLETNLDGYVYHGQINYAGIKKQTATITMELNSDGTYTLSKSNVDIGGFDTTNDFHITGHAYIKNVSVSDK